MRGGGWVRCLVGSLGECLHNTHPSAILVSIEVSDDWGESLGFSKASYFVIRPSP